jgi:PBSX family phage terminase large subunit
MKKEKKLSAAEIQQVESIHMMGMMANDAYMRIYGKEKVEEWKSACMEQASNFLLAGVVIQRKQWEFAAKARECDSPNGPKQILSGGGRGSSKSHAILAQIFCDDCQRIKGLKVLCLRKVGKANKEQIQDFRKKLLSNLPHNYREQAQSIEFDNGSLVILGNFANEKDIDKYLGLEYDLIYVMECNQLTRSKMVNIESCLRTNKTNWRPRLYLDTNPGGISHVEHKRIFVEPWKNKTEKETRYIHSTVDDNIFVNIEYKSYLEKLVGWQREAWLHGSWEFMAGAFFNNFYPDVHVYPNPQTDLNPRSIIRWFAGLDYGFSHPSAFVLCCEDENGNIFVTDVYSASSTLIEEHSANIRDLLAMKNLEVDDLEFIAAGKDCFRMDKDGGTVATEYQERGINLVPCQIDRINAWAQVAEVFGDIQHQIRPRCFIHKNCTGLIQQIQAAQSDPKKPNDILKMNCIAGDSQVLIESGWVEIKNIVAGDFVLTREGFKRVSFSGMTRKNAPIKILKLENGNELKITSNHRIWIEGKGWKAVDETGEGCDILLCQTSYCQQPTQENLTESLFTDTQAQISGEGDAISGLQPTITEKELDFFTAKSGNPLMVKFQKVWKFIIKMKTRLTTKFQIWNASPHQDIIKSTSKNETRLTGHGETKNLVIQDCRFRSQGEQLKQNAAIAESVLKNRTTTEQKEIFAANPALQAGIGIADCTTKKESANTVKKNFQPINPQRRNFVPCRVLTISDGGNEDVFNLEVDDCHEYFANGILVHNCDPETHEGGDDELESFRNSLVMAYSSLITNAKPVQMGSWKGLNQIQQASEYIDVDAIIVQSEAEDLARR